MKYFFVFSNDSRSDDVEGWMKIILQAIKASTLNGIEIVPDIDSADVIIVVGGDGTLLHAVRSHFKADKIFFGINRGTVGFNMNPVDSLDMLISDMKDFHKHQIIRLPLIKAVFTQTDDRKQEHVSFNDAYVLPDAGMCISGTVSAAGKYHFRNRPFFGGGVIVATPQGSTAFNHSVGGRILPLEEEMLAIATCEPQLEPIIEAMELKRVEVRITRGEAFGFSDNIKIPHVEKMVVEPSGVFVRLAMTKRSKFQLKRLHVKEEIGRRLGR